MTKLQDFSSLGSDLGRGLQTSPAQTSLLHRSHLSSTEQSPFPSTRKPQSEATRTWTSSPPSTISGWKQVLSPLDYWGGKKIKNLGKYSNFLGTLMFDCGRLWKGEAIHIPKAVRSKGMKRRLFFKKHTLLWFFTGVGVFLLLIIVAAKAGLDCACIRLIQHKFSHLWLVKSLDFSRKAYSPYNGPSNNATWPALIRSDCKTYEWLWQ